VVLRIRAGSVHPVTAPPISDGAVLVDDAGTIAAVGPHPHVPTPPGAQALAFPDAALVPGLINCHTHLELTHLAGTNPEPRFAAWIRRIRELKDATPPDQFRRSAEQGVRDCWARGVTCVADTGSTGAVVAALARLGGRGIAYHEVFGPDPAQAESSLARFRDEVAALRKWTSSRVGLGASPHAPYTVSAELYRRVAQEAYRDGLPLAVHVAESREEVELVRDGTGPFAELLRARGIAIAAQRCTLVALLARLGVLRLGTLCIHAVHLDAEDIAVLQGARAAVAHCPRSNRVHGHGVAPLDALRAAVPKGGSAVVLLAAPGHVDALLAELAGTDGEVTRRSLSAAQTAALERELKATPIASSGPSQRGSASPAETR